MVKHAGADDLAELASKFPDALDREPVELEIPDVVFVLERPGEIQASLADVDSRHPGVGLAQRVGCGLRRSAARHQYVAIWPLAAGPAKTNGTARGAAAGFRYSSRCRARSVIGAG